jgi:hypothetical protein
MPGPPHSARAKRGQPAAGRGMPWSRAQVRAACAKGRVPLGPHRVAERRLAAGRGYSVMASAKLQNLRGVASIMLWLYAASPEAVAVSSPLAKLHKLPCPNGCHGNGHRAAIAARRNAGPGPTKSSASNIAWYAMRYIRRKAVHSATSPPSLRPPRAT